MLLRDMLLCAWDTIFSFHDGSNGKITNDTELTRITMSLQQVRTGRKTFQCLTDSVQIQYSNSPTVLFSNN
jgi:hypothetical protein